MEEKVPKTRRMKPIRKHSAKGIPKRNNLLDMTCQRQNDSHLQISKRKGVTWKRMKWIKDKSNCGFLNQKSSSRGLSFAPVENPVIPAFSNAKVAIICCSFAPTRSTSCIGKYKTSTMMQLIRPILKISQGNYREWDKELTVMGMIAIQK